MWRKLLHHFFIPHEGNDHTPHFFHDSVVALIIFCVIALEGALFFHVYVIEKTDMFGAVLVSTLLTQTNEERAKTDLFPVKLNPLLSDAASRKARDMAEKGYFSHQTPDGVEPWRFLEESGYSYSYAGENLAVNFSDSKDVTEAWLNSPTHKENILNRQYSEMGIGVAEGVYKGRLTTYVVQFFATPAFAQNLADIKPEETERETEREIPTQTAQNEIVPAQTNVLGESTEVAPNNSGSGLISGLLSNPRHVTQFIFISILSLIVLAFLLAVFIKIHIQRSKVFINGAIMLALIALFWFANTALLKNQLEIPDVSASVASSFE